VVARARYSTLNKNAKQYFVFFFHEIKDDPRYMQYPVVELRVMAQEAQSKSLKAFN